MTDILNARRNGSDICWILKDYESKISYFNNYKTKEIIRKALLDSVEFKYDIKLLSDKMGKTEGELLKEAESILSNMSHNIGMNSIRFMGVTLSKIMKRLYTHVHVNDCGIAKLREAYANSHVVLLPTHRSYADFLLVSYVMFAYNLPMPVIAAAMDFMNMKFVGELLRSCGAFFIRRSFVDDDLYWTVFSHYIKTLIKISQESLEFFIEGTRSRTNKSLHPKLGMLGIILEMWLSGSSDVKIVPIGISYDRILEERLYAWELFGVPKPKESTSGLLKVRHILSENFGNVYFNVGDPISISDLANRFNVKRLDHNLELRFRPTLFESEKEFLRQLSKIIVEKQQQNCIVSDWSVIVVIFLSHEVEVSSPLTINDLVARYMHLTRLLSTLGAMLALHRGTNANVQEDATARQHIISSLDVHRSLISTDAQGVRLVTHLNPSLPISDPVEWNSIIVNKIHVGIYRNPLLFHLAKESILINRIRNGPTLDEAALFEDFKSVFDLLSREFIYSGSAHDNYTTTVEKLRRSQLLLTGGWWINAEHPCVDIVQGVILPYLIAYIVYGHVFLAQIEPRMMTSKPIDQVKVLQESAIKLCRHPDWLGSQYFEICSLDIARNALAQINVIIKRDSVDMVRQIVAVLNIFLCQDTRLRLASVLASLDIQGT